MPDDLKLVAWVRELRTLLSLSKAKAKKQAATQKGRDQEAYEQLHNVEKAISALKAENKLLLAQLDDLQDKTRELPSRQLKEEVEKLIERYGRRKERIEGTLDVDDVGASDPERIQRRIDGLKKIRVRAESLAADADALDKDLRRYRTKEQAAKEAIPEGLRLRDAEVPGSAVNLLVEEAKSNYETAVRDHGTAFRDFDLPLMEQSIELLRAVPGLIKEAKQAAVEAKDTSQTDLKAMKQWHDSLAQAEAAQDRIMALAGASEQLKEIKKLIARAKSRIKEQGPIQVGFQAALDRLARDGGYEDIKKRASEASDEFLSRGLSKDLDKSIRSTNKKLEKMDKVAPEYIHMMLQDELVGIAFLGRSDPDDARQQLEDLNEMIQSGMTNAETDERAAQEALTRFDELVTQMEQAEVPVGIYAAELREGTEAKAEDMEQKEWETAGQRLKAAADSMEAVLQAHEEYGEQWEETARELATIRAYAKEIMDWPPLATKAQNVFNACQAVLEKFRSTRNYDACLKDFFDPDPTKGIDARYRDLQDAVANGRVPQGADLAKFIMELREAEDKVFASADRAETRLHKLIDERDDVDGDAAQLLRDHIGKELVNARQPWTDYCRHLPDPKTATLNQNVADARSALQTAENNLTTTINTGLNELVTNLKREEQKRSRPGSTKDRVLSLIDQIEQFGAFKDKEREAADDNATPESDLRQLERMLRQELKQARKLRHRQQKQALLTLADVQEPLRNPSEKEGGIKARQFKPYKEVLQTETFDVQELIDSDDPYLQQLGFFELKELDDRIKDFASRDYKEVSAKWEELSPRIGKLEKVLPDTKALLYDELTEAMTLAQRSNAEVGMKALEAVEAKLEDAEARYLERKKEIAECTAIEDRLDEYVERLRHKPDMPPDRFPAFDAYFQARLNEAKAARKQESSQPSAKDLLAALREELKGLKSEHDVTLAEGKRANEQRLIRDMARQFQVVLDIFTKQTLARAKEVVEQDPDGDRELLASLETTATTVKKNLAPYLDVIGKKKKPGAKVPPLLETATAEFDRARTTIADATRTAEQLASGFSAGTNVQVANKDALKKVQQNWITQVRLYAKTLRAVAAGINEAARKDTRPEDAEKATMAALLVHEAAGQFRPTAFAKPFAVLLKEDPNDPNLPRRKLAAREEALRTMRRCRTELLHDPVITVLTKREKNPFDANKVMAAVGGLGASLKRIQRTVLTNV